MATSKTEKQECGCEKEAKAGEGGMMEMCGCVPSGAMAVCCGPNMRRMMTSMCAPAAAEEKPAPVEPEA